MIRHYMFGYLQGLVAGAELEKLMTKYKKAVKAHRKIGINELSTLFIFSFSQFFEYLLCYNLVVKISGTD